ncbi:hypothetical protein Pflav_055730 [Phytohabitans flavus]|uniref:Uncharacterized protein n=1 Tax=Phytohabitans flavus TaxID=1076124 RepID=A0A6F8XZC6_9ACTN|nr:hypothetical protein Pflav_055730 [Phytohabitans flavus]
MGDMRDKTLERPHRPTLTVAQLPCGCGMVRAVQQAVAVNGEQQRLRGLTPPA